MSLARNVKIRVLVTVVCFQCALGAVLPLLHLSDGAAQSEKETVSWPRTFEGAELSPVALSPKAHAALHRFPGDVALFSDGSRYVLMRRVNRATRLLHSSADCLRGMGHEIRSRTVVTRADGGRWARITTDEGVEALEQIRDHETRKTWTDVSAWFWDATFHSDEGPWLAVTILSSDFGNGASEED